MARLARRSSPQEDVDEEPPTRSGTNTRQPSHRRSHNPGSLSPSPAASFSSDKENHGITSNSSRESHGKPRTMPPPRLPTPGSTESTGPHSNKRRRLGERDAPHASQAALEHELSEIEDTRYYDPDQPMEERRAYRRGIRDLARELIDSRSEYMAADSNGLEDTVNKANDLFKGVKQTSDATLDSRLLVTTSDISARRSAQLKLGGSSQGIDVDDFVAKCVSFMRKGPTENEVSLSRTATQQRRRRTDNSGRGSGAEDSQDEGDELNWEWLGRKVCFPHNVRPPVPGFLLGPLSVQKRVRKQTQRREKLRKQDPRDAVRPEELKVKDIERVENSNLTTLCKNIKSLLDRTINDGQAKVNEEATENMIEDDVRKLMYKHNVADDGGVPLFHFVVNPYSFGQTIENFFYISFLIRDGHAGLGTDSDMLPTLHATKARTEEDRKEDNKSRKLIQEETISRHQGVFHIDFETWEDIVAAFELKSCVIPHRRSDESTQVGANGWYG